MRNQILFKMFCYILLLLLNCSIINCTSLVGSKATVNSNINRIIHASLTDKDTGHVWRIQELVYSGSPRAGRIEINSDENEANVFYSYQNLRDNNKRLVIHDNECDVYNYDLKWDNLLPGVNKPLTNIILLLGPSLLDRFSGFDWANGNDEIIRGSSMHSVSTVLDGKLNITLFYQYYLNQMNGIQQPSQIVFTGYNPDTLVEGEAETLILDIYLQSQTERELDKLVQVTPGFGCPVYLNGDVALPELNTLKIHFIAAEKENYDNPITSEFHADETHQILRKIINVPYEFQSEVLIDYSLGAAYRISGAGSCITLPFVYGAPGIDESGSLSIAKLLWLTKPLKYLGEMIFEHRSGYRVHVWESTETNRVINDKTYDKVVTTQYLSSSYKNDIFNGYSLVAASIKAYTKDAKGSYVLSYSSHRDYYDSNSDLPESTYQKALQAVNCFQYQEQRLNLKFHLTCKDSDGCIKKSQDSVYEMKELFRSILLRQLEMSFIRVADIDFKFQKELIEADVTFLEAPKISDVLPHDFYTEEPKSISILHETVTDDVEKCLRYHSSFIPTGAAIIELKQISFKLISYNLITAEAVAFQVTDVIAQNGVEEQMKPFHFLYPDDQFDTIDGVHTVRIPGIERFGDCYRACSQNEDIPCETFSFCDREDSKECVVSIWSGSQIKNNRTGDRDCMIYEKSYWSDYTDYTDLKFKETTTAVKEMKLADCISECRASKDCVSFQYCSYDKCSIVDSYVTATNTEYDVFCDIYVLKSSLKYSVTGTKLVSQVLYTEVDLDLEQCATLCDDDQSCKSFNFCPKGKAPAQCQITSYSIKDPKTESVDSSICHNFELTVKSEAVVLSDNIQDSKVSGVSGVRVFGIIMLFLFVGLFAGFVGPYAYT